MITADGASVWPRGSSQGDEGVPTLRDIARGLSRMPRFAGQLPTFYSVLAHTLTVHDLVPPEARAYALLHDAPEAIVGDVPTTWKTAGAREHERDLLERITASVGLPWPWPVNATRRVHEADAVAIAAEAHTLGHVEAEAWWPFASVAPTIMRQACEVTRWRMSDPFRWARDENAALAAFECRLTRALEVAER